MEATVLYSSAAIHAKIKSILGQPKNGERRVAIVAYVGEHAPAYLPQPKGLSLICCPAPGATSAAALRRIMHAGANVRFAERLHMKVYWSQARGCIITSANLSSSALGASGLKEAGVFLPPGSVDIDELIHRAKPEKITDRQMRQLERASRRLRARQGRRSQAKPARRDYLAWYRGPHRSAESWKLGWWTDLLSRPAAAGKALSRREYDRDPEDWFSVKRNLAAPEDWLLCFELASSGVRNISWMYVDFVVPVRKSERAIYESGWPQHAIQVHGLARYSSPPFQLDASFRAAFRKAVAEYGAARLQERKTMVPPKKVLDLVAERLSSSE